ncbi:HEAT repeat domain-containing protein [Spirillospora sp. NPDC029432]|uniref:HEAT repeat domain-containing protein n=1 Tax=Spirillospora sp. NPDC029432 TaxID=3154599 RepID=UPI0034543508
MSDRDPLAGLDDIDWAALGHAYGTAEDVPGLLRGLRSGSADEREEALHALYGNIYHQGSRYEASAAAVPFLSRLAADPAVPGRADIVELLASLALGFDEAHLPGGVDIAAWRAQVERLRSSDAETELRRMDEWVAQAPTEGERRVREGRRAGYDHDETVRYLLHELGAYDAVRAEVPALRGLLRDPDAGVRAAAAYTLGWFPEEAAGSLPALHAMLRSDRVQSAGAHAIVSLGLLGGTEYVPALREALTADRPPLLRSAAAIALAVLGVADEEVLGALEEAAVRPPEQDVSGLIHLNGNLRGLATQTLALVEEPAHPRLLGAMLKGLALSSGPEAFATAEAVLRTVFGQPEGAPLPPYDELTEPQRRAVRTLAEMDDETWRWGNFMMILGAWGVPSWQAECRAYAGLAQGGREHGAGSLR